MLSLRSSKSAPPTALLPALALLAAALPLCLLAWRLAHWPGWEGTDEAYTLSLWQRWHEGLAPDWIATRGVLHRALVAGILALDGWRFAAVRWAAVGVYLASIASLFALARRVLGREAGWATLAVAGAAALPAVHLGSLLSPQLQPLLWCLAAAGALAVEGTAASMLWGLACALALLDYEAWPTACPGLFVLLALRPGRSRRLVAAFLGFTVGVLILGQHALPVLDAWAAGRRAYSAPGLGPGPLLQAGIFLKEYFVGGGSALPTQGVPLGAAQFPVWALPFLAAALLRLFRLPKHAARLRWGLWVCAVLPFAVFVVRAPGVPAERVLAAWPPLCLLAGDALAAAWRRGAWAWCLVLWIPLGGVWEAHNFVQGYAALGDRFYGGGNALLGAAKSLRAQEPVEFFSELDAAPRGDVRLALGLKDTDLRQGKALALVPWEIVPALKASGKGSWQEIPAGPGLPSRWLYAVPPAELSEFREAHAALKDFWDQERDRFYASVYADLVNATRLPIANPIVRDALWEARFLNARRIGAPEPAEGEKALALGMLRVDPLLREARALALSQPAKARTLLTEALRRDPRRREAWRELRALTAASGDAQALAKLDQQIDALPPDATFEPSWLRE